MKKITTILAFLIISSFSYSQNDDSYSKTLNKMFALSKAKDSYDASIKQMFNLYRQQNPNLDSHVWNELEKELLNSAIDDLVKLLVPVYKKHFTEQELNFMKVLLGKNLQKKHLL